MADSQSPAPAESSPKKSAVHTRYHHEVNPEHVGRQIKHLENRLDDWKRKREFLDTQKNSEDHDIDNAKKRADNAIKEHQDEIKRLQALKK